MAIKPITIGYTIYNKEKLIKKIIEGLSRLDKIDSIFFFDACTDESLNIFKQECHKLKSCKAYVNNGKDIFEILSNNFILKQCKTEYCVLFQDDLIIKDGGFLEIAEKIYNNDSVAGIVGFKDGYEMDTVNQYKNIVSSPWSTSKNKDRDLKKGDYCIRTFVNRGPLIIPKRIISNIGYFDESFYPLFWDDNDYSMRARQNGFRNYVAYSEIETDPSWGTTRAGSKISLKNIWIVNQFRFAKKWGIPIEAPSSYKFYRAFATSLQMKMLHFLFKRKWKKRIKPINL